VTAYIDIYIEKMIKLIIIIIIKIRIMSGGR
jgi:hypothetical protein